MRISPFAIRMDTTMSAKEVPRINLAIAFRGFLSVRPVALKTKEMTTPIIPA